MPTYQRLRLFDFILLFICAVLTGAISGITMSVIHCLIGPEFFTLPILYFPNPVPLLTYQELYWRIVTEGLFQGLGFGGVVAIAFTGFVFWVSRASCDFRTSVSYLPKMAKVTFVCWILGGFNGLILAALFPQFLINSLNPGISQIEIIKIMWVASSICGAHLGVVISIFMGCTWFKKDWQHRLKSI